MIDLITEIWSGLNDAGMPEVMLYLPDGTAYRCHWDETAMVGDVRVALLADQDRKIVRIVPVINARGSASPAPRGRTPRAIARSSGASWTSDSGHGRPAGPRTVRGPAGGRRRRSPRDRGWNRAWTWRSRLSSTRV